MQTERDLLAVRKTVAHTDVPNALAFVVRGCGTERVLELALVIDASHAVVRTGCVVDRRVLVL